MTTQERIAKYLEAIPAAISGAGGHNQIFNVACSLYNGWNLSQEDTLAWLRIYNQRCQPPWTDKELAHKAAEAAKAEHNKPRGHLLDASIAAQRPEPDWALPSVPIASGKISTTLTTVKTNLRAYACNVYGDPPVIPPARKPEINVVNVVSSVVSVKTRSVDSEIDVVNVVSTHTPLVSSATDELSPSLDKNLDPPKESSKRSVTSIPEELSAEQPAEAHRIAKELVKLRDARAISGPDDPEAVFFAHFVRTFEAEFTGKHPHVTKGTVVQSL